MNRILLLCALVLVAAGCSQKSAQIQYKAGKPQQAHRPKPQEGMPFQPVFNSVKEGPKAPTSGIVVKDLDAPGKEVQEERVFPSPRSEYQPPAKPVFVTDAPTPHERPVAEEKVSGIRHVKPNLTKKGKFIWPVEGEIISAFGPKSGGLYNDGVNIAAPLGAEIHASMDGTVLYIGDELKSYGNLIIIRHANGWMTAYAHTKEAFVKKGEMVRQGQVIASVGSTGNVKTPQLHFGIREGKKPLDPVLKVSG